MTTVLSPSQNEKDRAETRKQLFMAAGRKYDIMIFSNLAPYYIIL